MKKFLLLLTGVMLCFFFSCTKDEKLSSEKQILEFSISSFGSTGNGKIDEVAKTITFEVPAGTDVTKLAPFIKVSSSATVVPAIGVEQDFTNPVSYTVTAEDGSVQVYVVKIVVLKSVEKQLLSFKFAGLTPEVTGKVDEVKKTVSLQVPYGTDVTGLVPTITSSKGAAVTPASGAKQDFTKAVTYTVTAEDGSKQEYVVAVEVGKNSEKKISEFKLAGITPQVVGVVNEDKKTISLSVPFGTDVTGLVPTITSSKGAAVTPASGAKQDFTKAVTYTVTAEDGSKQEYVVAVEVGKNSEKMISEFKLAGITPQVSGVVNEDNKTISISVPFGTDVTGLVPTITSSKGALVSPASGAKQDFTKAVTYTVTAEDGSKQEYVVAVVVGKNSDKKITGFKLAGIMPQVLGVVNEEKKTISLSVPFGTDVTGLVPTITSSNGAIVTPASGAKQDFTKAVTYTVTAEDGSKQEYVVAVEVGKSSDKKISEFKLAGITPQVSGVVNEEKKTISLSVPFGTDVTGLVPTITSSKGAIVTPASGAKQDFTKAVTYTVTAEDGSKQEYSVTIVVCEAAKSSLKRMTAFRFAGLTPPVDGVVDEMRKTIAVTVPFGTNVRALIPTITISEKAIVLPASAEEMDFIIPVDYKVTAEDGSSQVYRVEVKIAPEVIVGKESKIMAFKFAGLTPAVVATVDEGAKFIYALVPFGTDITKLVPTITISGDASISPKSDVETDYSRGMTYTVTAMDGKTKTKYDVSVEVAKEVNPNAPVITSVKNADNLMPGIGNIIILGKNLRKEGKLSRIKIGTVTMIGIVNAEGTEITATMSSSVAVGATKVSVRVDVDSSNELDITIKENPFPAPVIESVDKTALVDGDEIVITGSNFMAEGNGVLLSLKSFPNTPVSLVAVSETPTMLKFKFDKSKSAKLKSGPYKLSVYSNGKKVSYGVDINVTL